MIKALYKQRKKNKKSLTNLRGEGGGYLNGM